MSDFLTIITKSFFKKPSQTIQHFDYVQPLSASYFFTRKSRNATTAISENLHFKMFKIDNVQNMCARAV